MRKVILGFILVFAFGFSLHAQIGHLDMDALKREMPDVIAVESKVKLYRMLLIEQGVAMVLDLQKEYDRIQRLVDGGCLTYISQRKLVAKILIKQNELSLFEAGMEEMIQTMKTRLMIPILDSINSAIQAVAQENQFQFILDEGSTSILFIGTSSDVSALVRGKLGM